MNLIVMNFLNNVGDMDKVKPNDVLPLNLKQKYDWKPPCLTITNQEQRITRHFQSL